MGIGLLTGYISTFFKNILFYFNLTSAFLLLELDYEKWKHRRAIFNPGFHRQ